MIDKQFTDWWSSGNTARDRDEKVDRHEKSVGILASLLSQHRVEGIAEEISRKSLRNLRKKPRKRSKKPGKRKGRLRPLVVCR